MRRTVVIVDDHAPFRDSAAAMLEAEGFRVVGNAVDGADALAQVRRSRPAVVVLDVQLPGMDGFAVAERIADMRDPPVVVLISGRSAASYGARLAKARAAGFIPKLELSGAALTAMLGC